ncbi:MAG: arylsulfatase [Rikenellaceae bacterium]
MKTTSYSIFAALALLTGCQRAADKPNVILIVVDDQGYADIGAHGNEHILTPNLDKLHAESSRFTQYHVSPTSAPTRAAMMSGRHSNNAGVWHTVNGRSLILEREVLMPQIFSDNGYSTAMFGKWHLGDNYPFRPQDKGFDEVLMHHGGGVGQTMDYWDNDYFDDMYYHNGVWTQYEGYCNDVWFEKAKEFISSNRDKPFFCYLATNVAHSPYWVADEYAAPYQGNESIVDPNFYGMIANVDENIGVLTQYLEDMNLADNTIIIFTTDNGTARGAAIKLEEDASKPMVVPRLDGFVVKGENDGMRGIKASMYEGGHRVPLFIHWKDGGIDVGQDINELAAHYDLLPTLIDMCGLSVEHDIDFDGVSLRPLIEGDTEDFEDRFIVVNSQRTEVPQKWRRTALLQGDWRIINGEELYNLSTDPEQRNDISAQNPEKMAELTALYDEWWAKSLPNYQAQPYFVIGNSAENPTTLHCHDWHSEKDSPWHQRHIRDGYIDNGHWLVEVDQAGSYRLRLRRWPKESGLGLCEQAPIRPAIEGTSVTDSKVGKALSITKARVEVQGVELSTSVACDAQYVEFVVDLQPGETELKSWFTLKDGRELGAYYVEVEKI